MAKLISFTIRYRGRDKLIGNLRDAKLMAENLQEQLFKGDKELARIVGMLREAISGHQTPTASFTAFARFAYDRGLAVQKQKSAAWEEFARSAGMAALSPKLVKGNTDKKDDDSR